MLSRSPYSADARHADHIHVDWVDLSLKNTEEEEYLRIPYRWSDAARTVGFGGLLTEDFSALLTEGANARLTEGFRTHESV